MSFDTRSSLTLVEENRELKAQITQLESALIASQKKSQKAMQDLQDLEIEIKGSPIIYGNVEFDMWAENVDDHAEANFSATHKALLFRVEKR